MVLFINKAKAYNLRENMALVKVNIDSFKKDVGGIFNRMVDKVVNKIEDKLENAVEDLFAKALKKIGLSDKIASEISARFGDALTVGLEDKYFQTFTSEMKRASCADIRNNFNPNKGNIIGASASAETYVDAIQRASNKIKLEDGTASMQFPEHMPTKYYMAFKFKEYQRPAPEAIGETKFKQAFVLPLPKGLREAFEIQVGQESTGMMGGIADTIAKVGSMNGEGQAGQISKSALAIAYGQLVQKSGDLGSSVAQAFGAVPNPHLQALFSGVPLRSHRFEWTFSPRNPRESEQLMTLLKAMKAYSLPSYSTLGTAALAYPFLCQPELVINGKKSLIAFQPCLIQSVELNYSPQGLPAFFEGTNHPAFIEVSISMLETQIQTARDYGREGGDRLTAGTDALIDQLQKGLNAANIGFNIRDKLNETEAAVTRGIQSARSQTQSSNEE
jgi:hypothetical protein